KVKAEKLPNSGFIDRFYFRSFYFREPNGILIELATDGPGFAIDEDTDYLGEKIALPPFLEPKRAEIERDRKSTRLNSSHVSISYAVFCLKKKKSNSK